jgi:hypothetical protein
MKKLILSNKLICERCEKLVFSPGVWEVTYQVCRNCLHTPINTEEYFDNIFDYSLYPKEEQ